MKHGIFFFVVIEHFVGVQHESSFPPQSQILDTLSIKYVLLFELIDFLFSTVRGPPYNHSVLYDRMLDLR